ncbi:MAG: hypothetical protein HZA61_00255, partial [Candidatus Eisenbacteria bacterium]|nr:hypothetical protein [Candidatus Eisenbacteria bacterium]
MTPFASPQAIAARTLVRAALAAALALACARPAGAQLYQVTDLGTLGGVRGSGASALGGNGLAVGYSFITGAN